MQVMNEGFNIFLHVTFANTETTHILWCDDYRQTVDKVHKYLNSTYYACYSNHLIVELGRKIIGAIEMGERIYK